MQESLQDFDKLHRKHKPGFSFNQSERGLKFPDSSALQCDNQLSYHAASKTQKVYSAFQNNYYLPPHLSSSKSHGLIHKGECKAWKIRKTYAAETNGEAWGNKEVRGRHVWNSTTNYDVQYRCYEDRVKALPTTKYHLVAPRIKYLIEQDRPTKPSKIIYSDEESQRNDR